MGKRRSHDRAKAVIYRVSVENRELLKARAASAGYTTLQDWLDAVLLGDQAPKAKQEALPMTG